MMSATFSEMKLRPGFTFYVVEAIKRTRIQTAPPKHALPFGVSAAVGLIAILLSLTTPYSPLYPIGEWIGSALPSRTQVVEKSVIPVDAVNVAQITILSNDSGKKDFGQKPKPEPMKFFGGGKWEKKGDMPTARGGTTAEIVKDKIYVIGGFDGVRAMSTVLEYDPIADTWTQKADMPTARFDHAACVVDGKIYVIGGYNRALAKVFSTVEAYDPARDMWTKHPDMPTARYVNSAGVVNGMIYVCGGGLIGDVNDAPTRVVERYNPITGKWTKEADMLSGRQEFSVAVLGGKIYAFGGGTILGNIQSTVEVLDIGTQSVTPAGKLPTTWGEVKAAQ
ncbi:hypothetical protein HYR99_14695 [Candidatus Poribacteria bacterium]|nr:hypothetical protein [Candidatus Poribacteria bacterium]